MTLRTSILAGTVLLGVVACGPTGPVHAPICGQQAKLLEPGTRRSPLQCGPSLEFTPINSYQGEFSSVVRATKGAVALIDGRCTGTLIAASAGPVVLTAGHCVGLGNRSLLVFNFEEQANGDLVLIEGTVIEQSALPDYALIHLDALPAVTPVPLTSVPTERLAIIQHPRGMRKVIAEGGFLASCNQLVYYADVDTLVGSSGAGVLTREGHLLGIHTDGDCDTEGRGSNRGWTSEVIVHASAHLKSTDIVER